MSYSSISWDIDLIQKYNYSGPRYTSYPTALEFNERYTEADFLQAVKRHSSQTLSLYVHIPFCHKLCYFCGCNKIVTRHSHKADEYLQYLAIEIKKRAPLFKNRNISQIHWGGGTPTYLNKQQISRLMKLLRENFSLLPDIEQSIEIDPREIDLDMIDHLHTEGFNRISMGIQDFNKDVQRLINREQDETFVFSLVERARQLLFKSINIDLIYGLPQQTLTSFTHTLDRVIQLGPDRLSVFNYAHLPSRFAAQRKIKDNDLPSADDKLSILQKTVEILTQRGYHYIGMDHFALPNDELAVAQRQGVLHRNFQGYTTQGDNDLLGLGVSAISMIGNSYAQNQKELKAYYANISEKGYALWKGLTMTIDDCIRRDVIKALICNFHLNYADIEKKYNINFTEYFQEDLNYLVPFVADGLVEIQQVGISITAKGRLLIRNICMCFDRYLRHSVRMRRFSRVI